MMGFSTTIGAGFNNQASAMRFAICFTSEHDGDKTKVNYEEAKKLYDFICENVQFTEERNADFLGDMVDLAKQIFQLKSEEKQENGEA